MRRNWLWASISASVLALAGLGLAVAQDDEEEETTVTGRSVADLTAPEQLAEAQRIAERGEGLSRRVSGMLDEARTAGDVTRVTCLDDKLTQINATRGTLSDSTENLEATAADDIRNHHFTIITLLSEQLDTLEREANECVGSSLTETGMTTVTTSTDPGTAEEDPTESRVPPRDSPAIPPSASL